MTLLSRENCHGRSLLRPEIESNSSDVVPIKSQGLIFFVYRYRILKMSLQEEIINEINQ